MPTTRTPKVVPKLPPACQDGPVAVTAFIDAMRLMVNRPKDERMEAQKGKKRVPSAKR